jgi:hypothetical protein
MENSLWKRMWTTSKRDYVMVVMMMMMVVVIVITILNYNYGDQFEIKPNSSDNLQCRKSN